MSHQSQGGFDTLPDPSTSQRRRASFNHHATYRRLDKPPVPPITPPPPPSKQFPTRRYIHPYLERVHPPLPDIDIPIISLLDPTGTENLKDQYNIFPICRKRPLVISTLAELGALAASQSRDTLSHAWVDQTTVAADSEVRPVGAGGVPCHVRAKMADEAAVSHSVENDDPIATTPWEIPRVGTTEGRSTQGTSQLGASVSGISRVDTFTPTEVSFKERIEKWASTAEAAGGGEGVNRRYRAVRNLPSLNDLVLRPPSPVSPADSVYSVLTPQPNVHPIQLTPKHPTPIPNPPVIMWRNQQVHHESSSYHTLLKSVSKLSLGAEDNQLLYDNSLLPSPKISARQHHNTQDVIPPLSIPARYDPYMLHQQLCDEAEKHTEEAVIGEEMANSRGSRSRIGSSGDGHSICDWSHRTAPDPDWAASYYHSSHVHAGRQEAGQISATILSSSDPTSTSYPTHHPTSTSYRSLTPDILPTATLSSFRNPAGPQYTKGSTSELDQYFQASPTRRDSHGDTKEATQHHSQPTSHYIARPTSPSTSYSEPNFGGRPFSAQSPFIPLDIISLFAPSNIFEPQPAYSISNHSSPIQQLAEIRAYLTHATIVMHLILSSARFLVDQNNQTISLLDSLAQAGQSPGSAKSQAAILDHGLPLGEAVNIEAFMKIWWYSEGGRLIRLWRYITDEIVELVRHYEEVVGMADYWEVDEMVGYEVEWWEALRVFVEPTLTSWANQQTAASPIDERYLLKLCGKLEAEGRVAKGTFRRFNNRAKGTEVDEVAVVDPVEVALVGRKMKTKRRWRGGLATFLAKVSEVNLGMRSGRRREEEKAKAEVISAPSVMLGHNPVSVALSSSKPLPPPPQLSPQPPLPILILGPSPKSDTVTSTPSRGEFDTDVLDRFLNPRTLPATQVRTNESAHYTYDPSQMPQASHALALATAEVEPKKESQRRGMAERIETDRQARDDLEIGRKSTGGRRVGTSRRPHTAEGVLARFGVRIRA